MRFLAVTVVAAGAGAYVRSEGDSGSSTLNPLSFTKYQVVSKDPVSSTGSIFTLRPTKSDHNAGVYEEAWRAGVWSVMFKQPQLQIGRDYTPLPPLITSQDEDALRFFIRRDPAGEVSRYVHRLELGETVEMRGPQLEYKIPNDTRQILFIAGGTGIAPALQASHTLLNRTRGGDKPRIHILWANRRREDCLGGLSDTADRPRRSWLGKMFNPLQPPPVPAVTPNSPPSLVVRELEALKAQHPGQITVDYFVDEEKTFVKKENIMNFTQHSPLAGESRDSQLILVSGPEGFISYMAGPKMWAQGVEVQGPLGGIIRELNLRGWGVWKL